MDYALLFVGFVMAFFSLAFVTAALFNPEVDGLGPFVYYTIGAALATLSVLAFTNLQGVPCG